MTFEIIEVCAELSDIICNSTALSAKVKRVLTSSDIELETREVFYDEQFFFDHDVNLTQEEQKKILLRYKFSYHAQNFVLLLAIALKYLVDEGIQLTHDGVPLSNIVILCNLCFDVTDLIGSYELNLHADNNGKTQKISSFATYKNMLRAQQKGSKFCNLFGRDEPEMLTNTLAHLSRLPFGETSVPHWWIGAVVQDKTSGNLAAKNSDESKSNSTPASPQSSAMVHIDICGCVYDESGFTKTYDGNIVSFLSFVTPHYGVCESRAHDNSLKFLLTLDSVNGLNWNNEDWKEPWRMRHLRIPNKDLVSGVEVLPLEFFIGVQGSYSTADAMMESGHWKDVISRFFSSLMLRLPIRTPVRSRNLNDRKDLNGEKGTVAKGPDGKPIRRGDRLGILFKKEHNVCMLKGSSIKLTKRYKQYLSYNAMKKQFQKAAMHCRLKAFQNFEAVSIDVLDDLFQGISDEKEMEQAIAFYTAGVNFKFSMLANDFYLSLTRKSIQNPACGLFDDDEVGKMTTSLKVFDDPRGPEVLRYVLLLERALQKSDENAGETSGAVKSDSADSETESDYSRLLGKVASRVEHDESLVRLFKKLSTCQAVDSSDL